MHLENLSGKSKTLDSLIVRPDEVPLILSWLPKVPNKALTFEMLYRATIDGFEYNKFHEKCDGNGPTISFIENVEFKNRFGGFTNKPWLNDGTSSKNDN